MITQRFEFTKDFMKEWKNSVYFRLDKMLCGFKDQVRACPSGEKCGLLIIALTRRSSDQLQNPGSQVKQGLAYLVRLAGYRLRLLPCSC